MKWKRKNGRILKMQQVDGVDEPFRKLFFNTRPARVLEIGTGSGAFAVMLREVLDEVHALRKTQLTTVDVKPRRRFHEWERIEAHTFDCFTNEKKQNLRKKLRDQITGEGVTLVLCDGGDKLAEFQAVAKLLKPGDIVGVHDYAESLEDFKERVKGKIWGFCGIHAGRMEDTDHAHRLTDFMAEDFRPFVWGMRRRLS